MLPRLETRASNESGFTLIELMVAITIIAVGVLGLIGSIDKSRDLNTVAENNTLMTHVAEKRIEFLNDLPYAAVAMNAARTAGTGQFNPDLYVCSSNTFSWNQTACPGSAEPMVIDATNGQPTEQDWFDQRTGARGKVRTYVTWVNDTCPNLVNVDTCPGTQDYKRITVAVTLANGKPRTPVLLNSFSYDDAAGRLCSDRAQDPDAQIGSNCG